MKKQREIVVSALGQRPMMDKPFPDERSVTRMIEFWRGNLAAVLPDHPDLIVVYEDCDNYPLYTTEESLAYYECRGERVRDFLRRRHVQIIVISHIVPTVPQETVPGATVWN